jgi:hypothetical protein
MSSAAEHPEGGDGGRTHSAGAFDVRNVIAALIGVYGVVLVIMGLVADGAAQRAKTGGVNADLWAGIVMAVVALAFLLWTRLRPIVVDPGTTGQKHGPAGPAAAGD